MVYAYSYKFSGLAESLFFQGESVILEVLTSGEGWETRGDQLAVIPVATYRRGSEEEDATGST